MKVTANIKYLKISPQKLRLGADMVRTQKVQAAQEILSNMSQKSARMVYSGLKSAIANAENNHNLDASSLKICEIRVDQGPSLKRGRPRARGSYGRILHPMSHLRIVLEGSSGESKSTKKEEKEVKSSAAKPKVTTKITTKKRGAK